MRRRGLLLGLGAVACGARPRPPPPSAPRVGSALDLVPPDLDVVLRLDLGRIKATLGMAALSELASRVIAEGGAEEWLLASLLAADVVYLGFRPDARWLPLDRVLALQGRFPQLSKPPPGFSGATDLGADLRYWEAKQMPATRGGVARVYALGDRVRAFVSEAELDAVERSLAGLPMGQRLTPDEAGTLSLAGRAQPLARVVGRGRLGELLEAATRFGAVADLEADGVQLRAELVLETPDAAASLASAGDLALRALLGDRVERLEVRADAERVLVTARFGRAQAVELLGSAGAGQGG